jgi:hypothetical protein
MDHDASHENDRNNEALVADFFTRLDALVLALHGADVSRATPPELRRLVAVMDEVEDALHNVVTAVDAANRAS